MAPSLPQRPVASAEHARVGLLGRTELLAVLAACVVIFALYVWAGGYWIDLIDEGYFVYLGSRVHAGDLPYRDFDSYYTPGIFYLFAWTFDLFGVSVAPIRVLMSGMRILWALVLYLLVRRVAPWPFAWLPFVLVAGVDAAPVFPEPHPSWPSMLAALATVEVLARHLTSGRRRWVVLAGVLAGVSFAFKQNVGAFAVLSIGAYLLLRGNTPAGWLVRVTQVLYAVGLSAAVTLLLWPGLTPPLVVAVWLPLVLTFGLLAVGAWRQATPSTSAAAETGTGSGAMRSTGRNMPGWLIGLPALLLDAVAAGVPFLLVTVSWLVPLTLALGVQGVPWGLFVGQVNQGALILPLDPPPLATRPLLLVAIWLPIVMALLGGWRGPRLPWVLAGALLASVLLPVVPVGYMPDEGLVEDPGRFPWLAYVNDQLGGLFIYLPSLGAWAGVGMLAASVLRQRPSPLLGWYLAAGMLLLLALYPRIDTIHAMFAGAGLFVVGTWALAVAYGALARRVQPLFRGLIFMCLLLVPLASIVPHVYWRYVTITHADPRSPTPPAYVELGLPRAQVRLPEHIATSVRGAVEFVQAGTPPGAPFFVYPVVPLFNFLADRPNPTRFNHFIAGALTPEDLQAVIADLERAKPRYILWDHGGATYFKADLTNRVLSDYIWGCYEQVANYTPYLILERRCP